LLLIVVALPVLLARGIWAEVWRGILPGAWDGSGHYALASIYSETVFPNTFGWTGAYFAGMGLPNYYPPLCYWLVALLQHSGLLTFGAAFKLVLALPVLLLPAALWLLAWRLSGRDRVVATCAALAAVPLLVDIRLTNSIGLMGLSYTSTFLLGLYTQPLGYVLLVAWYILYVSEQFSGRVWRVALAAVLLALALLANFFSSNIAVLLAQTTLAQDAVRLVRAASPAERRGERRMLFAHLLSPLAGVLLTMFWLAPLLGSYDYVVTRPEHVTLGDLVPTPLWVWYVLALTGAVLWLRRSPARAARPFLAACALLFAAVFLLDYVAPRWFPAHPPRLVSTLNFLLAAPVGYALASVLRLARHLFGRSSGRAGKALPAGLLRAVAAAAALASAVLLYMLVMPPPTGFAYYDEAARSRISPVLEFAQGHRGGRYLVENQPLSDTANALDGRSLSAYLGMQGNESLSLFFREGAPNVLFLNPLADAFSTQTDSYGLSSALVDDADFARRTTASQIERARLYGTKYLVIRTQAMKERLAAEPAVSSRHDFGEWSVFELAGDVPPLARPLIYRPALIVSDLSLKLRRRGDYGFVRLAEEQFNSGWFDVALALAPESRLDRLEVPEGFGSVVVDAYTYDDAERAYARLREVARSHHLVLLSADDPVFRRVLDSRGDFPQAEVIERGAAEDDGWLDSARPTRSYDDNPVRMTWRRLQEALDRGKVPAVGGASALSGSLKGQGIEIIPAQGQSVETHVLVAATYHPRWQRADGGEVYVASPFFMLTFVRGATNVGFKRVSYERAALWVSAGTLLLLCSLCLWDGRALHVSRKESDLKRNRSTYPN
jgi:hypothetical protein